MSKVMPAITVFTGDQIDRVHEYSLKILSTVGVRVDSKKARQVFAQSDGVSLKDQRAYIRPELVETAIKQAPSTIDVYDRKGCFAFRIGNPDENPTRFGVGVTNLFYQDPLTDNVEPFKRKHMVIAARLGQILKSFDLVSTPGIVQDFPAETADLYATLELVTNTIKPIVLLVSNTQLFERVLDLIEALFDHFYTHPFVIPYFNPITPLVLNEETTDMMAITIERGLPLIFSNYGMSGASAPITPAGTIAVLNAELLAGLVFAQLLKPGAPVILGSLPAAFDMQCMVSRYSPKSILLNLACAEMMAHYELPHAGTSGSGTGWGPDLLASGTLWMNHLASCLGKAGLAPFVGGNFESLAFSPSTVVYADYVIQRVREFVDGFKLDEGSVGLEEIASVGPAGNYLGTELTLKYCHEADYATEFWPILTLEQWQSKGQPKAGDLLRKYASDLVNNLQAPENYEELVAQGEEFIKDL
ncbi:MAG: hypothetical protein DRH12_05345 [Deltaproteobacteria bacterium]|nr:MAG: hypothetical protein DRH12_05345 [Deltaproteobacteria bacterium]